jgi:hypothetical protein
MERKTAKRWFFLPIEKFLVNFFFRHARMPRSRVSGGLRPVGGAWRAYAQEGACPSLTKENVLAKTGLTNEKNSSDTHGDCIHGRVRFGG